MNIKNVQTCGLGPNNPLSSVVFYLFQQFLNAIVETKNAPLF
jgi:hypothetical protein